MSFIADIWGASQAAKGQKQAASAAKDASAASLAEQKRQYDLSRADMQPWLTTGSSALSTLGRLYGLGGAQAPAQGQPQTLPAQGFAGSGGQPGLMSRQIGEGGLGAGGYATAMPGGATSPTATTGQATAPAGQFDSFWQSPDYNFRANEQMRALTARNAALGIQDSGAAQRAALQLSGNLASSEYNNYANRLAALAGVGQSAANTNAQLGGNYANAVTGINGNLGQQLGSSYTNRGNIWGNLVNNLNGQAQQAASSIFGGFG